MNASLKTIINAEAKLHLKPWLAIGIMVSLRQKDMIYKVFFSIDKDCSRKKKLQKKSKNYRNDRNILSRIPKLKTTKDFFKKTNKTYWNMGRKKCHYNCKEYHKENCQLPKYKWHWKNRSSHSIWFIYKLFTTISLK